MTKSMSEIYGLVCICLCLFGMSCSAPPQKESSTDVLLRLTTLDSRHRLSAVLWTKEIWAEVAYSSGSDNLLAAYQTLSSSLEDHFFIQISSIANVHAIFSNGFHGTARFNGSETAESIPIAPSIITLFGGNSLVLGFSRSDPSGHDLLNSKASETSIELVAPNGKKTEFTWKLPIQVTQAEKDAVGFLARSNDSWLDKIDIAPGKSIREDKFRLDLVSGLMIAPLSQGDLPGALGASKALRERCLFLVVSPNTSSTRFSAILTSALQGAELVQMDKILKPDFRMNSILSGLTGDGIVSPHTTIVCFRGTPTGNTARLTFGPGTTTKGHAIEWNAPWMFSKWND